ncbi:MAG: NAD(+) synthase [archaeon]
MEFFKNINYAKLESNLISFIQKSCKDKKVLVGLSGGIDSCIVCVLAVKALGKENVKALIMTNVRFFSGDLEKARAYAKLLGVEIQEIGSDSARDAFATALGINESNVKEVSTLDARVCDLLIRFIAMQENRIMLGTIDNSERLAGWYPKGTLVGDLCPIGGLLKHQIIELAKHLNLDYLAETVSNDATKVCGGCGALEEFSGIPYETLDSFLYLYETTKKEHLPKKVKEAGISLEIMKVVLERIEKVKHKQDLFPKYLAINKCGAD